VSSKQGAKATAYSWVLVFPKIRRGRSKKDKRKENEIEPLKRLSSSRSAGRLPVQGARSGCSSTIRNVNVTALS
jgi:hypothetical protein